ncbi:MAG TPA: hypothetical protein V6D18_15925 [Thermosynechococcaceae cyanobacterium]
MTWELCLQYSNGRIRALHTFQSREAALKQIDIIYAEGYPMHVAYVVRPAEFQGTADTIAPKFRLA